MEMNFGTDSGSRQTNDESKWNQNPKTEDNFFDELALCDSSLAKGNDQSSEGSR
jgi:hypothetical protein